MKFIKTITIFTAALCFASFTSTAQWTTNFGTLSGGSGVRNTNIGYAAGQHATGQDNVNLGLTAGLYNTGSNNIHIGRGAGELNASGNRNVYLGMFAGAHSTGSDNVFVGFGSGMYEPGSNLLFIANNSTAPLIGGDFIHKKVGIGLNNIGELANNPAKLQVNGAIACEEISIQIDPGAAPDYVFKEDYKLRPLEEVQAHINEHSHLPEVPSAVEMESEGVEVGKMNMLLLKKIEELTLYQLQLLEMIKKQQEEINALKTEGSE